MAEAEERSAAPAPKRFFCHMCNVEINIPNADYTCPLCANGFIEELPANAPELTASTSARSINNQQQHHQAGNPSASASDTTTSSMSSTSTNSSGSANSTGPINVESLRNDIVSLLNMRNVPNSVEISFEPNRRLGGNVVHLGEIGPSVSGGSVGGGGTAGAAITAGGRVRPANLDRLDNVLFDFLQSLPLTGATAEFVAGTGNGGPGHMFFMGNPGDYAWGREGLDTIVTQMLNQMETSGPPPLSTQRISEIPNVKVTTEEVDRKMQCSICWDDFKVDESVRKLPCSHLYHEACIVPWLNLHSTCPICRKSLAEEEANEDFVVMEDVSGGESHQRHANSSSSMATATTTLSNNPEQINSSSQAAAAAAAAAQSDTATAANRQQQRNNVFTFDEDDFYLD